MLQNDWFCWIDYTRMRLQGSLPRVFRCVAFFFLLFTAVDLTVSEFCREEIGGLSMASAFQEFSETERSAKFISAIQTPDDSQNSLPSDQPIYEDCFCCCAHVVPGLVHRSAAIAYGSSYSQVPTDLPLPSPPLRGPFHPPRLV